MIFSKGILLVLGGLAMFGGPGTGPVFGANVKLLPGHVPREVSRLTANGRLAATRQLPLALGLPLRDPAGLDALLAQVTDPASPNYRHFLTPEEITARFGPTEADYAAVQDYARTNGLTITMTYGNRLVLGVAGPVAAVERAFHVTLRTYPHPTEARDFFAPDTEPSVAVSLPVTDIGGLDNFRRPHPKFHRPNGVPGAVAKGGTAPDGISFLGPDLRNAYAAGVTLNGAGQMVGLLQFDGFSSNNITAYEDLLPGKPRVPLKTVLLDGYSGAAGSGEGEVCLDIEMAIAMAPALTKIIIFEGQLQNSVLNAMASSNMVKSLSCSWAWGGGPSATTDNIFKIMAVQGQSFFNASGDTDAFAVGSNNDVDSTAQVNAPSSCPYITQVGGTVLTMNGAGASFGSETVWNDRTVNANGGNWGSSGGISTYYPIPSWQAGTSMTAANGSATQRNIPDVALIADYVYSISGSLSGGRTAGTSCAAPLWAGFMALVNQQAYARGNTNGLGLINAAVFALSQTGDYSSCFHDTVAGDNTWSPGSPSSFYAVPGYDLCTGLGTPAGQNLINALAGFDALMVAPLTGAAASGVVGGPFTPASQIYTLTNSSASPLNWSLMNTSAWLAVSASSGTLAVGGQTTLTISLNSAANSLAMGNYAANVGFSNQTSHVVQTRQFTLQVTDPLLWLTGSTLPVSGPAGGPFAAGNQGVAFTNLGAAALNWSLINTSAWLSVSSGSGFLAGNGSLTLTVATNAGTASLVNGIYQATLVLSNPASHFTQGLVFSAFIGTNIVPNGGFETGNFPPWTQSGNTAYTSVSGSTAYVHSGTYGVQAGPGTSLGYLTQNLATYPGQQYLLSFWLANPSSGSGQQFQASWNGATVYNVSSPGVLAWTNQKFVVTATGTNTALQLGFRNDPAYFSLDDVSVTPISPPAILQQPASQTNVTGANVTFTAVASGAGPLAYQWRTNGVKLVNSAVVSGATSNLLTLTAITTNFARNYTLIVTNAYGSVTSSIAILTVIKPPPPTITTNLAAQTVECGGLAGYAVGAAGAAPLRYQWRTNGVSVAGATNVSFTLTNVHLSLTVAVVVTNLYGRVTNSAALTVQDTFPPNITLNGSSVMTNELGSPFTDPGATAYDACAGAVAVVTNGTVNTGIVGTNLLKYTATDGSRSATNTRSVIVRDTTPPVITWSFTNLTLTLSTNCAAPMPNVTGTNGVRASDLSGALTITQTPTNNFNLPPGTNLVVITVKDASGNAASSTNKIIVRDTAAPVIAGQPASLTNSAGSTAVFNVAATACTPLVFQWYFNNGALAGQTSPTLTLTNLTRLAAGKYIVVATAAGGSATSQIASLSVMLNTPPKIAAPAARTNGGFTLNFAAVAGFTYILQTTTNPAVPGGWLSVATNTSPTNGATIFTDPQATNFQWRFYRLMLGP